MTGDTPPPPRHAKRTLDIRAAAHAALQPLGGDGAHLRGRPVPPQPAPAPGHEAGLDQVDAAVEAARQAGRRRARNRRTAQELSPIRRAVNEDIAHAFEESPPKSLALPGSVLHLPLPSLREEAAFDLDAEPAPRAHAPAVDLSPVLEAWVTPLVGELARMRVELAEMRARETAQAQAPRGELFKLLAGILLCFALVAAALVLVIKA